MNVSKQNQSPPSMNRLIALALGTAALTAVTPALATDRLPGIAADAPAPTILSLVERQTYAQVFAAIRGGRFDEARNLLNVAPVTPLLHYARAELLLAPNSPAASADEIMTLLAAAPTLPQAQRLARLGARRGVTALPTLPAEQRLMWVGGAPRREAAPANRASAAEQALARSIPERIREDDPAGAEALLNASIDQLSPAARTEWQQRIAWSYYIENDDVNALRMAEAATRGTGEWTVQAHWVQGLAAWRRQDCRTADTAFDAVARGADDAELRAAGQFWGARAATACGQPAKVQPRLRAAAANPETFYGVLAADALNVASPARAAAPQADRRGWRAVADLPNVRIAAALAELGDDAGASDVVRHQARIGAPDQHEALTDLAGALSLPETQLFLAHNAPTGRKPGSEARYPAPNWEPNGGWRVDPSLVFAHTLQESQFKRRAVSPAGAYGLMQVRPGTARDVARWRGGTLGSTAELAIPSVNMDYGQSYLEHLRDNVATGGLLPKVIAAYNAGPTPVARWNSEIRDGGDPLLFIESIPYWETRGYVSTVLRNYWMYQRQAGSDSASASEIVQGKWPKFPTLGRSTQLALTRSGTTDAD